jgi:large subunit ribosomal protein L13e
MKHNNQLPNGHFKKHWSRRVRTWLDQAGAKKSRRVARATKAALVAPRPVDLLRPAVRCQTVKYNRKVRAGRGFSLDELKVSGWIYHGFGFNCTFFILGCWYFPQVCPYRRYRC